MKNLGFSCRSSLIKSSWFIHQSRRPPNTKSAERCHASRVCRLSRPVAATAALPQVSSFGVGGTNGHAIFWGEKARRARSKTPLVAPGITTSHKKLLVAKGIATSIFYLLGREGEESHIRRTPENHRVGNEERDGRTMRNTAVARIN